MRRERLTAIDLCCGAGGWACAARGLPIEFLTVADLSPIHLETWRQNHAGDHPRCRRLRCDLADSAGVAGVLEELLGHRVDLIVGGIPCEQVSQAAGAQSAAIKDAARLAKWHALIDNVLSIVAALKPRWWAIEDVVPLQRHLPTALELGWHIPRRKIDAHLFGPQRRRRLFLGDFPAPLPPDNPGVLADCLLPGPHKCFREPEKFDTVESGRNAGRVGNTRIRVLDPSKPSWTILGAGERGSRQRRAFSVRDSRGRLRQLSMGERARIQGFPADFLFDETAAHAEKQIGQAIPIYVGRAILEAIVRDFLGGDEESKSNGESIMAVPAEGLVV